VIKKKILESKILAIGPGLGLNSSTIKLVHQLIKDDDKIIILDADGLNALSKDVSLLKNKKSPIILTPHPKEMSRLINQSVSKIQKNRIKVVKDFCQKYQVYLVLKGYYSIIGFPNGRIWINPTGNPAMANAGQGDTLTGIISGLVSQFYHNSQGIEKAILLGVYLHGLVGDILASKGDQIVLASDIIYHLNEGFREIKKSFNQ
jgi:NAD(P)H-hydrate epimerase